MYKLIRGISSEAGVMSEAMINRKKKAATSPAPAKGKGMLRTWHNQGTRKDPWLGLWHFPVLFFIYFFHFWVVLFCPALWIQDEFRNLKMGSALSPTGVGKKSSQLLIWVLKYLESLLPDAAKGASIWFWGWGKCIYGASRRTERNKTHHKNICLWRMAASETSPGSWDWVLWLV